MRLFLIYIALLFSLGSFAQRILNFNLVTAGSYVGVRFTIAQGFPADGYKVYRSTDSLTYQPIYSYDQPCGSYSGNVDESFTDMTPALNQVNFYYVDLIPVERSATQRIYVAQQSKTGMRAYPDPVTQHGDLLTLFLTNITQDVYLNGYLYNQYGMPLRSISLATQQSLATLGIDDLDNGLYIIWLNDGQQAYSAKFIILR